MPANVASDDPEITVASTTDSQEAVDAAAGVEKEEAAEQEESTEKKEGTEESSEATEGEESEEKAESDSESETEGEEEEEAEEESEAKKGTEGKGRAKLRKRVDKLTAKLRQQERDNQTLKDRLAALEEGDSEEESEEDSTEEVPTTGFTKPKPKQSEFKDSKGNPDVEAYLDALTDWKSDKKDFEKAVKAEETHRAEVFAAYIKKQTAFKDTVDDWDEVAQNAPRVHTAVQVACIDAENPELIYELAKNHELCEKMNNMSPGQAVLEPGRFEASLEAKKSPASKTTKAATKTAVEGSSASTKKTASTAKAPIKPVGGGATKGSVTALDQVPYREYVERRNRGER